MDWDDARVFLAVSRASSLRAAAASLGVSHPTVRRHLERLEEGLGVPLFERHHDGLRATPQAAGLVSAAEAVERAMDGFTRTAQAVDPAIRGPIRVTLPGELLTDLLMPDLVAFSEQWPEIELHIDASYRLADLSRREADVALRFVPHGQLPHEDLVGRKVANAARAIYGTGDSWIGWRTPEEDMEWIRDTPFAEFPIRGQMNYGSAQRAACRAGLGITMLPCFYADPYLVRRTEPEPGFDIWILVHPDLRKNPRLRVFRETILRALSRYSDRLRGVALRS